MKPAKFDPQHSTGSNLALLWGRNMYKVLYLLHSAFDRPVLCHIVGHGSFFAKSKIAGTAALKNACHGIYWFTFWDQRRSPFLRFFVLE
jgi:hypothetical protein